jgi:hypothetical protein
MSEDGGWDPIFTGVQSLLSVGGWWMGSNFLLTPENVLEKLPISVVFIIMKVLLGSLMGF